MGNENTVFTSSKLFIDARDGRIDSVRKGLKTSGVEVNIKDEKTGRTPLCVACMNNMNDIVRLLLKKKIHLDIQDKKGLTALHYASYNGYTDIVMQLIAKQANPNIQDNEGFTALHYASSQGHHNILLALLLYEQINISLRNMYKLTAAQIAKNEEIRALFYTDLTPSMYINDNSHINNNGSSNNSNNNEENVDIK